jgi:hypothetical protein
MQANSILRKELTVGIIFLLVGLTIIPITPSEPTLHKKIITVDDEPGDADYTSIKEAVQHAQPGDTIQVYSGTYYEHDITISYQGITLQGIPHELGTGNDTGKPVVTSTANLTIFYARGDDVTITGFVIIDGSAPNMATFPIHIWGDNCTFSYNNVTGGWETLWVGGDGYDPYHYPVKTSIIGNTIEHTTIGIDYSCKYGNISYNRFRWCTYRAIGVHDQSTSTIISHNDIDNCSTGILYNNGSDSIISYNFISASNGIDLGVNGANNISFMKNKFQRCGTGIRLEFKQSLIQVRQNNFINNTRDIRFVQYLTLKYKFFNHRIFDGNYYDTWRGSGPKWIWGITIIFEIPIWFIAEIFFSIPIWIPWVYRDLNPALQPYDIPGMR